MEKKEITFRDLYLQVREKPTPAQLFVKEIAELTKRSEGTVRMWISERQVPDALAKSLIADHFGVSAETLFPIG